MRHIKLFCLCFTVALATCVAAATGASATPEHIYKIEGVKLETGEKAEITAKAKTEIVLKGEEEIVGAKVKWVLTCIDLKLDTADKPMIVGGRPGTSEKEKLELERCTATLGGTKCSSVTVEAAQLNDELVTIIAPSAKLGDLANWLFPASGKTFYKIKFKCGIFGGLEINVEDSTAVTIEPEKAEVIGPVWGWKEKEFIGEIERQNGEKVKVGLMATGFPVTVNGEVEVELVSKQKWGAF
jgi:hypothetical protein